MYYFSAVLMWNSYTIAGCDGRCRAGGGGRWGVVVRSARSAGRRFAAFCGISRGLLGSDLTSAGSITCYLVRFGAIWLHQVEWFGLIDVLERNKKWLL